MWPAPPRRYRARPVRARAFPCVREPYLPLPALACTSSHRSTTADGKVRRVLIVKEADIQKDAVEWAQENDLLFVHPYNGAHLKSGAKAANNAKKLGVINGVPDLICMEKEHGGGSRRLAIEFKSAVGRLSPAQQEIKDKMASRGWNYVVCRDLDEFIEATMDFVFGKQYIVVD